MSQDWSRRHFISAAIGTAAGAAMLRPGIAAEPDDPSTVRTPHSAVVIASGNGLAAVRRAYELIGQGVDPLDAAIAGVNIVEDDPNDNSVGYGGLPNEDGVVELDASVMHGPTHKAGSVASLQKIRNPSKVARLVMLRTDHELLVGEGALRFAKAHGFAEENLLTDKSRQLWLDWRERRSEVDAWLPPASQPTTQHSRLDWRAAFTYGTINCLALNERGDLSGVTTTSGLSFKLAGRVGDSPIIGAGLYVDNEIGAAGSTGRGEANLLNCSSFSIVEMMGRGMTPVEACMEQLRRVVKHTERRLLDSAGRPTFGLTFYALRKDGAHGSATMTDGEKQVMYAVADGAGTAARPSRPLYSGK